MKLADIKSGKPVAMCDRSTLFGLHYTNSWNSASHTWDRVWFLDNAPVGFGIHGSRNPTSE